MEKIAGIIQKVIFSSPETGYAVTSIIINYKDPEMKKYQDYLMSNLLTVTCYYDRLPIKDEEYEYTGEFVEGKYGLQLKASTFTRPHADTLQAVVIYLSSEMFPGIGKTIAKKVFNTLGSDCLKKIKKDKEALEKVEGLTPEQKETIYFNLIENERTEKAIVNFLAMGFTLAMAKRIQMSLSKKEMEIAKTNPYILMDKVEGIGFLKADRVALDMGIKKNDPIRLEACLLFILHNNIFDSGNTYIEKEYLKSNVLEILNKEEVLITDEIFEELLINLCNQGKIVIDENNLVYDIIIHHSEVNLAACIISMIKSKPLNYFEDDEIENTLRIIEKENELEYTSQQRKAIISALKENIVIITGGPGTGKTTIVKGIIACYQRLIKKTDSSFNLIDDISLLAPTGRAGKRLNELTNHPAQTIHKFLGYDGKQYHYGPNNKVPSKIIIVDEMSMVDVVLAALLFQSIEPFCKVVLVGDSDQIPSVSPGEVLSDLIKTKEITTIRLDKIHRQAQDSSIISLAHYINNGIVPENILEKQHDRNFIYLNERDVMSNLVKIVEQAVNKGMDLQRDVQVLIPMYRGEMGIDNCNNILQERFNPLNPGDDEIITNKQRFRIKDKVIQLINRNEEQIMNGDIGYIVSFDYANEQIIGLTVQFESKTVSYIKEEYDELKLAYAISIHKSQGSEFMSVIIPFSKKYYPMLKRRLYYTAITRAKKYLIMLGDLESLKLAAESLGFPRKTKLQELIKKGVNDNQISPYDFMNIGDNNDNSEV